MLNFKGGFWESPGFPDGSNSKVSACNSFCPQCGRPSFDPWFENIPWRRKWHPTPVLLPRKFHGWRSLVGYSPRGHKELDMTSRLHFKETLCFLQVGEPSKVFLFQSVAFVAGLTGNWVLPHLLHEIFWFRITQRPTTVVNI